MAEMSEEARVITETLEYHAEEREKEHEQNVQSRAIPTRSNTDKSAYSSTRSSTVELPPIQRSELDFMPMSKEKEAALSRTRPSWLPPKDPKEEKKHLKEYQRMMAASLEAEKKRQEKSCTSRTEKEDVRERLNQIWEQYVCPDWDTVLSEHRTRELWWRGVPPNIRGKVWERAVGNPLGLTSSSYDRALQRAKDIKSKKPTQLGGTEKTMLGWFEDIGKDAETTFPDLNLFQRQGPMYTNLVDICEAYACYRSDVGFLYGVHLIAAVLLLQLSSPAAVFVHLANMLNRPMPLAFLTNDPGSTARAYDQACTMFKNKSPRLFDYLFGPEERGQLSMSAEDVFEPFLRTMFTNSLDLDRLVRVWDCWVFEGDRILIRTAVAILSSFESSIFGFEGQTQDKRRIVKAMLGWGGTVAGRNAGHLDFEGTRGADVENFMLEVREAGKINMP